jgi:hypothetical protein
VHTIRQPQLKKDLFAYSNFYLAPSLIYKNKKIFKNKKIKYFGSLRYSIYWVKKLKKIFPIKEKSNKDKRIRIGIFTKYEAKEHKNVNNLINKLKKMTFLNVKTREKPRDVYPLKVAPFYKDELNSSQIINWSDYIISARSTSVLAEAIINNKKIFLLKYLYNEKKFSNLYDYKFIEKINDETELFKFIKKKYVISKKDKVKCLKNILVNYGKEIKMLKNYVNFYSTFKYEK